MVTMNDLEEYADPDIYDLENKDFEPDGPFFLDYAKKLGGSVLDLGCGTGRVTIPLAENDIDITGLDVVPGMIERAKQKAGELAVQWITQDVRSFRIEQTFRLIFETGCVFQHLLTRIDQEAFLKGVSEHLEDDGLFILNLLFPQASMLASVETEEEWFSYEKLNGREIRVSGTENYDPVRQVKLETAYRRWLDDNGNEILSAAPLSLRYVFPQELEALLHYNGFRIIEQYGDWKANPLTEKSRNIITLCKKR